MLIFFSLSVFLRFQTSQNRDYEELPSALVYLQLDELFHGSFFFALPHTASASETALISRLKRVNRERTTEHMKLMLPLIQFLITL